MHTVCHALHVCCRYALHDPALVHVEDDLVRPTSVGVMGTVSHILKAGHDVGQGADAVDEGQGLGSKAAVVLDSEGHKLHVFGTNSKLVYVINFY